MAQQKIMAIPTSIFKSSFALTKLLNMAVVRNFEAMLGQTQIHSV
jgi:hypothetical protein